MSATGVRETQRLETRARLFDAAVAEIKRSGLAGADVSAIVAAAGVARGTFYFHFPTKEHVVVELERNEEARIIARLDPQSKDLSSLLTQLVRHVVDAEKRLGPIIFRDMLGLHFSSSRPLDDGRANTRWPNSSSPPSPTPRPRAACNETQTPANSE